ncbi:hypothetical protein Scep_015839 [Stephania cephalantha]|uniref:Peptidase A1 domain-containing protein n=1 Tax=Stephania cephalantha TaxID=152367 RepID=A0AAP0J5Y5_9MAGN
MVIDTGSELSWFNCKSSSQSQPPTNTIFHPFLSSSYSPIPCSSPTCTTRTRDFSIPVSCDANHHCHATLAYADSSSSEGNLASDTFSFASSPAFTIFGCMDTTFSSNSDVDSKTTGLMGMNRGSLSFVSQMGFSKFSYCISDRHSSGVLLFGDSSFSWLTNLNYTPMIQISTPLPYFDRVAYTVQLEGIRVGPRLLALPKSVFVPDHTGAGQTMVDSGTQFTFLLGPAYTALKNEFVTQTRGDGSVLFGAIDSADSARVAYSESRVSRGRNERVGGTVVVSGGRGGQRGDLVYCFTFGNSDLLGAEAYIIGHHHQQNMWVEFDLAKQRVGLAPIRCDQASQRLGMGR